MKNYKNKNKIYINSNMISNFKPAILNKFSKYNYFIKNQVFDKNQIYCKNFFIFLLLIKYKSSFFQKSNIFIKKFKKKVYTVLRPPYRHKLSRHQFSINRYEINSSIEINLKKIISFKN